MSWKKLKRMLLKAPAVYNEQTLSNVNFWRSSGGCWWPLRSPAENNRSVALCMSSIITFTSAPGPTCRDLARDSSLDTVCSRLLGTFRGKLQLSYCCPVINEPQMLGTVWLGCVFIGWAQWNWANIVKIFFITAVSCFCAVLVLKSSGLKQ